MKLARSVGILFSLPLCLCPILAGADPPAGKPPVLNGIRETTLPNGLTVLTKEEHAAPVVYFSVWYKVGSVNEQVGQTGMSHLMEHMMFKGTKAHGPGALVAALEGVGAQYNADTWMDRTAYHEVLAPDRLELAMQLESDRMVNSLYDEAQHQKEMTVVRSEYEGGENRPSGVLGKAVRLTAYQVHPYRWDTIGFRSDIENFTRDEMYAYYKNYYTPNNATVVIVGDFDTAKALTMVGKYFGSYKPHPIQQHFITPEPPQEGERRVVVRRAGTLPLIEIAYHIPAFGQPDRYALNVLETVLSSGRTGRFFQDLVQPGLASDTGANDDALRDPDLIHLTATAQPGHSNPDLEKALLAEVTRLQQSPISPEELTRAISQGEANYVFGQEAIDQDGAQLGENAMKGDWRYGETYLENLRRVTAADVQRVAQKYLVETNCTVGYFEPILPAGAKPPTALPPPGNSPSAAASPDLAARPAPLPAKIGATSRPLSAAPTRTVLDNGLTIIVQENHAHPAVSVSGAILTAGAVFDPWDRRGLADLTAAQLSRGTQSRSLLDIARTLENVGASASVSASVWGGGEYVGLGGHSLSRDFDTVLDVLSDELQHPSFPAEELDKERTQRLASVAFGRQDTQQLAIIAFFDALFPPGHPYHLPTLDEQTTFLKGVTREDLAAFHAVHYAPDRMILTIVGDVSAADAVASVKKYFGAWPKKGGLPPVVIPDTAPQTAAEQALVIPVADKAQVDVFYGYPGALKRSDPDFYAADVLNTVLGIGFTGRLMSSVRDRMGLVYGIGSYRSATLGQGPFFIGFGSNPANVDAAVAEMDRQVALLREKGVTQKEVAQAISYQIGSYSVRLSTNTNVADELRDAEVYGLGLDYIQRHADHYRAVTADQVNAAAQKYLHPGTGTLVIAGTYTGKFAGKTGGK